MKAWIYQWEYIKKVEGIIFTKFTRVRLLFRTQNTLLFRNKL